MKMMTKEIWCINCKTDIRSSTHFVPTEGLLLGWGVEAFTHKKYTEKPLHRAALTHRRCYTQKLLHTEAFTQHSVTQSSSLTKRTFHTEQLLRTKAFKHRSCYTGKPLHRPAFTYKHTGAFGHRNFYTEYL